MPVTEYRGQFLSVKPQATVQQELQRASAGLALPGQG